MFTININGRQIPIDGPDGIDFCEVTDSVPFKNWLAKLDPQFKLQKIHIQSVDKFGSRIGFVKFKIFATDECGRPIPGIIFMRGGTVAILVVLECDDKEYAILTVQPRLATGSFSFREIPAGMLDGSGNFAGVAAKELKEEVGIEIKNTDLVNLSEATGAANYFYLSPGGSDETLRLFLYRHKVGLEEIDALRGRLTGEITEDEQIVLEVVPLEELWKVPDAKTIIALACYKNLLKQIP